MSAYHVSKATKVVRQVGREEWTDGRMDGGREGERDERTGGNNTKMGVKMDPVMYIFFSPLRAEEPPGGRSLGSFDTLIRLVLVRYYCFLSLCLFIEAIVTGKKKKNLSPHDVFLTHRNKLTRSTSSSLPAT